MSPIIIKEKGYKIITWSREEGRVHVHIRSAECEAKVWVEPEIEVAKNYGFSEKQLREIIKIIKRNEGKIRRGFTGSNR
jgi:hypothetical protein